MIIDIYNHFMPKRFMDRLADLIPGHIVLKAFPRLETLWDLDARLKLLDRFPDTARSCRSPTRRSKCWAAGADAGARAHRQ